MKTYLITIFSILISLSTTLSYSQNNLSIFNDFVGTKWIGHYQNSEDSNLVHIIKWKYDFDKQVVKEIKSVPEVDFYNETFYYLDYATNQIAYVSFMNRAMISKGTVTKNDGKLELKGKLFFNNGFQENKKTYEITKDEKLKDYFFRKSKDKWVQGHFIKYSLKKINP